MSIPIGLVRIGARTYRRPYGRGVAGFLAEDGQGWGDGHTGNTAGDGAGGGDPLNVRAWPGFSAPLYGHPITDLETYHFNAYVVYGPI